MATPTRLLYLLLTFALAWGGVLHVHSRVFARSKSSASVDGPAAKALQGLDPQSQEVIERLRPWAKALPAPEAGDWLAEHREPGQSFEEYVASRPPTARGDRTILYVAPLGSFTAAENVVLEQAVQYMGHYFGLAVKVLDLVPMTVGKSDAQIPSTAYRSEGRGHGPQFHSQWILQKVLRPRLPKDAVALIGFTAQDLWPGHGWNFVFGQADLSSRVGVWSMARFGDPACSIESRARFLRRTIKVVLTVS